jgi:general secretion pathway protein D
MEFKMTKKVLHMGFDQKKVFGFLLVGMLVSSIFCAQEGSPLSHHSVKPADQGDFGLSHKANNWPEDSYDDEYDEDEDDFLQQQLLKYASEHQKGPHGKKAHEEEQHSKTHSPHSITMGGQKSKTPDPVYTDKGFQVGGSPANGVVSKGAQMPTVSIDTQTGFGSDEVITDFNFPDADILDIAKALGKIAKKNFILDKDVTGKISIVSNTPITVGDAWKAFLTALDVKSFAIIPSGAFLRIAKQRDAREKQLPTYTGNYSPHSDALITRLFQLKYISATEVDRTFRGLLPGTARIIAYEQTNTVIVTDTGSNIQKLATILSLLDVEGFDAGIEVIPVNFASAAELQKLIDALIPGTAASPSGSAASRFGGGSASGGAKFNARKTKEGGIINTVIADDRTNTLILHANSKGANQVRELVRKLDQKPSTTAGGKVRVIYMQFADAEQIASTLNSIVQSAPSGSKSSGSGGASTGSNPTANTLFEGSVKIAADKSTNALVVTASPSDFTTIEKVVADLDIPRAQVYIEVVIMEILIQRNFTFSNNIIAPNKFQSLITSNDDVSSVFNPTTPFAAAGAILSFPLAKEMINFAIPGAASTAGQSVSIPSVVDLIALFQTNNVGSVLATPQIVALDNTEATFESAEKIPVPSTSTTANGILNSGFTKEPVSISIKIKPQINKLADYIKMDIDTKYSDVSNRSLPKDISGSTFATLERTATTSVVVADGDTIVIGGLIRDKENEKIRKVPLLGDIPILGWLFKSVVRDADKANLLIFLTPHINRIYGKTRNILDRALKERHEYLDRFLGGEDPLQYKRDEIIRSLPTEEELKQKMQPSKGPPKVSPEVKPQEPASLKRIYTPEVQKEEEPKTDSETGEVP